MSIQETNNNHSHQEQQQQQQHQNQQEQQQDRINMTTPNNSTMETAVIDQRSEGLATRGGGGGGATQGGAGTKNKSWNVRYRPLDWIFGIVVAAVGYILEEEVVPYCRTFSWDDQTINYQYKENTFPVYSLILIVFFTALLLVALIMMYPQCGAGAQTSINLYRSTEINAILLFLLHAAMINYMSTGATKVFVGRLRPDFLSRLHSIGYNSTSSSSSGVDFCALSKTQKIVRDGRKSFWSGHASTLFWSMTCLSCYLMSRLRVFSTRNVPLFVVIGFPLMAFAFIVAESRYSPDNRHHPSDIATGGMMGFFCGLISFKFNFVPLAEVKINALIDSASGGAEDGDETAHVVEGSAVNMHATVEENAWYLKIENRNMIGDHLPRLLLSNIAN